MATIVHTCAILFRFLCLNFLVFRHFPYGILGQVWYLKYYPCLLTLKTGYTGRGERFCMYILEQSVF